MTTEPDADPAGPEAAVEADPAAEPEAPAAGPSVPEAPAPAPVKAQAIAPSTPAADVERHLDPRYVDLSRLLGQIATAVIASMVALAGLVSSLIPAVPWWVVILVLTAGGALTAAVHRFFTWWPELEHEHHTYRVSPRGIEIRHGVWWRSNLSLPLSRVQHTDVSQGPVERRFGLATLHIHTAGTEQAEVALPGLAHATALAIRDHLVTGGEDDAV